MYVRMIACLMKQTEPEGAHIMPGIEYAFFFVDTDFIGDKLGNGTRLTSSLWKRCQT